MMIYVRNEMNKFKVYFKGLAIALGLLGLLMLLFWLPALMQLNKPQGQGSNFFYLFLLILLLFVSLCLFVSVRVFLNYSKKSVTSLTNTVTFVIFISLFSFLPKESGVLIIDLNTTLWLLLIICISYVVHKLHLYMFNK